MEEVRTYVSKPKIRLVTLVSISIAGPPEVAVYIRNQARLAQKQVSHLKSKSGKLISRKKNAKPVLQAMNDDETYSWIILQRPVPPQINVRFFQSAIHPLKDVEGMNPASIGNIVYSDVALAPCTAAASVELIKETGLDLKVLKW